jgi:hypothetical protein
MADPNEEIDRGKKSLKEISDIVGALDDGFQSLTSRLSDLAEGLTDVVDNARAFSRVQKDTISTLNKIAKANEKLIKNQISLNEGQLSSKKIQEQINELTATREVLDQRLKNLLDKQTQGLILSKGELDEIKSLQEGIEEITGEVTDNYQRQLGLAKEIEKKAGGFQKLADTVKSVPGLKGIAGPFQDAANAASKAAASGKSTFQIFKAGAGGLTSFLKGPTWITALVEVAKFFIDAMFEADKRVTNIAKNFSISKDSARGVYQALIGSKAVLTSTLATTKNITEAFNELASLSDFVYQASFRQLDTQIQLTKEIGIQAEEALQLQQLFALNNNESDKGLDIVYDQIAAFANQNKIVADGRKVIADVNRLSSLIKLNFRGNTGELVKTVLEAKKLGLTLDQVARTQSSLLDFESSISSQIEAELLTGRQINLERARLFALNNDIAGLTEEIAKQNITAASFSRMNAIQQESIAKTLGMSAGELGETLFKQELINKAGGQELKNKREYIALLKGQGKTEEANRQQRELEALEAGIVRGQTLQDAQKSLDAQTKFNTALERAKEIFSDLVSGGLLDSLSDILLDLVLNLEKLGLGNREARLARERETAKEKLGKRYNEEEFKQIQEKASPSLLKSVLNSIASYGSLSTRLSIEAEQKAARSAISTIKADNFTTRTNPADTLVKADDFTIRTNPADTLVMAGGTKLGNTDELLKTQQETNMLLKQLLAKDTNLYVDYTKFATAGSKVSYNI